MRLSQRDSSLNTAHCTLEVRKTTWISIPYMYMYKWHTLWMMNPSILTCNVYVCYVYTGRSSILSFTDQMRCSGRQSWLTVSFLISPLSRWVELEQSLSWRRLTLYSGATLRYVQCIYSMYIYMYMCVCMHSLSLSHTGSSFSNKC